MYILETFFHDIRIIKQIIKHIGSQSRLRDSKPRNNALHAFCGIETMELPLGGTTKRVFLNHGPLLRANIYERIYNADVIKL